LAVLAAAVASADSVAAAHRGLAVPALARQLALRAVARHDLAAPARAVLQVLDQELALAQVQARAGVPVVPAHPVVGPAEPVQPLPSLPWS